MTADPTRKLKVFLCHSSHDKPAVREIYARLKAEGWIDPWLDEEKLFPGQDWDLEIEKAVEETDAVLVFLSDNSISKEGYIQREIRLILNMADYKPEGTNFILPMRLNECPLPRRLRSWHYVDNFPEGRKEWAYGRLLGSLKLRAKKLGIDVAAILKEKAEKQKEELAEKKRKEQVEKERKEKVAREAAEKAEQERIVKEKREAEEKARLEKEAEEERERKVAAEQALWEKVDREEREIEKKPTKQIQGQVEIGELEEQLNIKTARESTARMIWIVNIISIGIIAIGGWYLLKDRFNSLGVGSKLVSEKDGMTMVYVPAGEFQMGRDDGKDDEKPVHTVYLDAYWIDQTEVTNAMYRKCVAAGECFPPYSNKSYSQEIYYENHDFDNYPVIYVSWEAANSYCSWSNRRLPTEAEWEKAASWNDDVQAQEKYPWGNDKINSSYANYQGDIGDMTEVGHYKKGQSFYGAYDLVGNVWEWVADWYASDYYLVSSASNPLGPDIGEYRVLRGGAWNTQYGISTTVRLWLPPESQYMNYGFRCAMSADEP